MKHLLLPFLLTFYFCTWAQNYPDNVIDATCILKPNPIKFGIQRDNISDTIICDHTQHFIGDIDNDGRNEVVVQGALDGYLLSNKVIILDDNLQLKTWFPIRATKSLNYLAIADVDNDGFAEIFSYSEDNYIQCYTYNGTLKWEHYLPLNSSSYLKVLTPSIADVNSDGVPDLLVYNSIYNAITGNLEVTLPSAFEKPVFADMDNDGVLEVVIPFDVIKVDIINANSTIGNNAYIWKSTPKLPLLSGFPAVADIDLDGFLDMVIINDEYLFVWNAYTGISYTEPLPERFFIALTLTPTIADVDNDNYPEIFFMHPVKNQLLYAYKYNSVQNKLNLIWTKPVFDANWNSISTFDFNFDYKPEIVYKDTNYLRIIDGATGNDIDSIYSISVTTGEYPVIADLKRTGEAQIIVTEKADFYSNKGRISSFKSKGDKWAPARNVWNQFNYSVVHINNNLTIPSLQFNPTTPFTNSAAKTIYPFNNFLQQQSTINKQGEYFIPLADIKYVADSTIVSTCEGVKVKLLVYENGSFLLKPPFGITVYKNNYRGEVLHTEIINRTINKQLVELNFNIPLSALGDTNSINQLIIALNDKGTGVAQNGNQQMECDTTNNIITVPIKYVDGSRRSFLADTICLGEPYIKNGFNIPADSNMVAGNKTYKLILPIPQSLCDSIVTLNLVIHPTYNTIIEIDTCNSYTWYDSTYTKNTVDTKNFKTKNKCDSTFTLILTLNDSVITPLTVHACSKYILNDTVYTKTGFYKQYLKTQHKCDSILNINLTIIDTNSLKLTNTLNFCNDGKAILTANTTVPFLLWSTGDTTSPPHFIEVFNAGTYWAKPLLQNCPQTYINIPYCNFSYSVPNAILPFDNSDANRYFQLFFKKKPQLINFEICIYNHWGNLVFQSKNPYFKWNGEVNGYTPLNVAYTYVINYLEEGGNKHTKTGMLNVIE